MSRPRALLLWATLNLALLFGAPTAAALYLQALVREEYRTGARVSTDGDSFGIPVAAGAVLTAALLLLVNVAVGMCWLWRRWRHAPRTPAAPR